MKGDLVDRRIRIGWDEKFKEEKKKKVSREKRGNRDALPFELTRRRDGRKRGIKGMEKRGVSQEKKALLRRKKRLRVQGKNERAEESG